LNSNWFISNKYAASLGDNSQEQANEAVSMQEFGHIAIVVGVLTVVAGFGFAIMTWAYSGAGSVSIVFREIIPVPVDLVDSSRSTFQRGIANYIRGQYRRANEAFSQVLTAHPDCSAAQHNLALTYANLRQDDKAAKALLKASQLYLNQTDQASINLVKQHLESIRRRKNARNSDTVS
jgi:tetratricopeptide (TPR) repeat protein